MLIIFPTLLKDAFLNEPERKYQQDDEMIWPSSLEVVQLFHYQIIFFRSISHRSGKEKAQ